MKLHRDAATTPAEMAYYQTPATAPSTWRADLARIGIVVGLFSIVAVFVLISAYILFRDMQIVGIMVWLMVMAIMGYLAWYALGIHNDVAARQRLDRARIYAEIDALTTFDTNQDGTADNAEVDAFINYMERIHRPGASTTADFAQKYCKVTGPDWTRYKRWLIRNGYADQVRRRGGDGFVLKPSVVSTPWPKLEAQLRQRVTAGLADGLTINDTRKPSPTDRVSTLDD